MGKLDDLRALGPPEISRQYIKSGGTVATPVDIAMLQVTEVQALAKALRMRIAELELENANLKRELEASRTPESDAPSRSPPRHASERGSKPLTQADRARMYRERKKAAGK